MPGKCNCRGNGFLRVILASGRGRKGGTIGCQRSFAAQFGKQGSLDHSLDSVCGVQSPQMLTASNIRVAGPRPVVEAALERRRPPDAMSGRRGRLVAYCDACVAVVGPLGPLPHPQRADRVDLGPVLDLIGRLVQQRIDQTRELLAVLAGIAVEEDRPVDAVVAADQQRGTAGEQTAVPLGVLVRLAARPAERPSRMRSKPPSAAPWVRGRRPPAAARAWSECSPRSGSDIVSGRPGRRRSGPGPPPRRSNRRWHPCVSMHSTP